MGLATGNEEVGGMAIGHEEVGGMAIGSEVIWGPVLSSVSWINVSPADPANNYRVIGTISAVPGASYYQFKTRPGAPFRTIDDGGRQFSFNSISQGLTFTLSARACNAQGCSAPFTRTVHV